MLTHTSTAPLSLFLPPYRELRAATQGVQQIRREGRRPGSALVWCLSGTERESHVQAVKERPGGMALVVVLPPAAKLQAKAEIMRIVEASRPQAILPHHEAVSPDDMAQVLRRPPEDLGVEVTEYVRWRGINLDRETARVLRKTLALSAELRSVSALSRSLYLSRRALGRRFLSRGLPVPSHWLQFGRLLRVTIRLQNSEDSVLSIGYEVGYGDAFSLSNQMHRLTGFRPSEARRYLGWEWLLEAWLRTEANTGGLAPEYAFDVLAGSVVDLAQSPGARERGSRAVRSSSSAQAG